MKNKLLMAGAVAAFVAFGTTVQAIPITGSINFEDGGIQFDANSVTFTSSSVVDLAVYWRLPVHGLAQRGAAPRVNFTSITSFAPLAPSPVSPLVVICVSAASHISV